MTTKRSRVEFLAQYAVVWRRAAILALACIVLAAVASSDALHATLLEFLAVSEQTIAQHPYLGMAMFVAFAAISAMFAFVSAAVIVPVGVVTWGAALCMLLLWIGWILGGAGAYIIGRFLGRRVVEWLTADALLHRIERRVQRSSSFGFILLFQMAVPSEIPGYVLGLLNYGLPKYLIALAITELPYTAVTVYLGASFVERRSVVVLGAGFALVMLSVGSFYLLRRRLTVAQKKERD